MTRPTIVVHALSSNKRPVGYAPWPDPPPDPPQPKKRKRKKKR